MIHNFLKMEVSLLPQAKPMDFFPFLSTAIQLQQ